MKQKKIFSLGFFDGVHLGHQTLLHACARLARQAGIGTAAITFERHPHSLFTAQPQPLLNTTEDRCYLLQWVGMDNVLILPVTPEMMAMPWENFLEMLIAEGAVGFVCGYDFRFGKNGEGNAEKLAAFAAQRNLPWEIIPEQTMDGEKISSTRIRGLLEKGDLETANRLLGHPHILSGTVISGKGLGRTIGVPTANLPMPAQLVQLPFGVYACQADVEGQRYLAVTNIGTRPTVEGQNVTVEPWILDFDGDLYGKKIILRFHKFLRPEQKFGSLEDLKAQIQEDAAETYRLLK